MLGKDNSISFSKLRVSIFKDVWVAFHSRKHAKVHMQEKKVKNSLIIYSQGQLAQKERDLQRHKYRCALKVKNNLGNGFRVRVF